jgi:hypothetical protein
MLQPSNATMVMEASYRLREDGTVSVICPTSQNGFAARSIHDGDRLATLHGVVFDILAGSESRRSNTAPAGAARWR